MSYFLYHHYFNFFIFQTTAFHNGNSSMGSHSAIYLIPLFAFCDLLGGLSLKTMFLFTITTSLICLLLFYGWLLKNWGKKCAFWGTLFFGYSAVFQEFARSGSYLSYSILLTMIWILFFYKCAQMANPSLYGVFGFLTGLTWYGYGVMRGLFLAALAQIFLSKKRKFSTSLLFLTGMMLVIIPSIIILYKNLSINHSLYHGAFHSLFIDKENILDWNKGNLQSIVIEFFRNLEIFVRRMLGGDQIIEPLVKDKFHAHFLSSLLVVPMLIGIGFAFKFKKDLKNKLLLLTSFIIYTLPLLSSSIGYDDARRSLLYVLPTYCFIGIGMDIILKWLSNINKNSVKYFVSVLLIGAFAFIIFTEMKFVFQRIMVPGRDPGLLAFSQQIKDSNISGVLYYMEDNSVYFPVKESDVLKLALMTNGQLPVEIEDFPTDTGLAHLPKNFYFVKSPLIPDSIFKGWCAYHGLKIIPLIESPVKDRPEGSSSLPPFRLYEGIL